MKKIKLIYIMAVMLFVFAYIHFAIIPIEIYAETFETASEEQILSDIISRDSMFREYDLVLDSYLFEKRQTNEDDKTDYIWLYVSASNDEFTYSPYYKITYVLYNSGWLFEEYEVISSSEVGTEEIDTTEIENQLLKEYTSIEYVDSIEEDNNITLLYTGISKKNLVTKTYSIAIECEYSKDTSWKQTEKQEVLSAIDFNIIGKWEYCDDEGRLYQIEFSATDQNNITISSLLLRNSVLDMSDSEWFIKEIDSSADREVVQYTDDYLKNTKSEMFCFSIDDLEKIKPKNRHDNNYIWIDYNNVIVNRYQLEKVEEFQHSDQDYYEVEIDGIVKTKEDIELNYIEDYISDEPSNDEELFLFAKKYYLSGEIDVALEYLSKMDIKTEESIEIENDIIQFKENYGFWLGDWTSSISSGNVTLSIKPQYNNGLELVFDEGKTSSGKNKIFYLYDYQVSSLVYHSDVFSVFDYTQLTYLDDNKIEEKIWQENIGSYTPAHELYRIE